MSTGTTFQRVAWRGEESPCSASYAGRPLQNVQLHMLERRQFERLSLREEILAFDQQERLLGRILDAGGGGMAVHLDDENLQFHKGDVLRVRVVNPGRNHSHTVAAVVRHAQDGRLGLEFLNRADA